MSDRGFCDSQRWSLPLWVSFYLVYLCFILAIIVALYSLYLIYCSDLPISPSGP